MAYTVLARRYRSTTFDDVIGQDHVAQTLKKAIDSGRVAHAYLFCGTRGVGKTSMARILAKALNCEAQPEPTSSPCGTCNSCMAIARGEDLDVIEIDAASNRGIDNIRDLISNAQYRPAHSRFKVYIIDEVHGLSKDAFNALLKVLEEPPDHVKFILATTEAEKILPTILSRCQRYDFRNIRAREIAGHLKEICKKEKIKADDDALMLLAKAGAGSMRDALSLLDRMLSVGEKHLDMELVEKLLGLPKSQLMFDLAGAIAAGEVKATLGQASSLVDSGLSVDSLLGALVDHLRNLLIIRTCGPDSELVEAPGLAMADLTAQAQRFDPVALTQDITILEELRRQIRQSQAGRALLDATLVRMALADQFSSIGELLSRMDGGGAGTDETQKKNDRVNVAQPNVAQPPPAVIRGPQPGAAVPQVIRGLQPGAAVPHIVASAAPAAKTASPAYRRNLPHLQSSGRPLLVTFRTAGEFILPESVRTQVLQHCLHDDGVKMKMLAAVIMPDHVHLIFCPLEDSQGNTYGLAEIMSGIKGASAHSVNKMLVRKGHVWQDESFDHVLRNDESLADRIEYLRSNPVRKELVGRSEEYRWLWVEDSQPGAAVPLVKSEDSQPGAAVPLVKSKDSQPGAAVPLVKSEDSQPGAAVPLVKSKDSQPGAAVPLVKSKDSQPGAAVPLVKSKDSQPGAAVPLVKSEDSQPGAAVPQKSQQAQDSNSLPEVWRAMLGLLTTHGPGLQSLLSSGRLARIEDDRAVVQFAPQHETFVKMLDRNGKKDLVRDGLSKVLGRPVGITFEVEAEAPVPKIPAAPSGGNGAAVAPRPAPQREAAVAEVIPAAAQRAAPVTPELVEEIRQSDPLVAALMQTLGATVIKVE